MSEKPTRRFGNRYPLEAFAIESGLNKELVSEMMFHPWLFTKEEREDITFKERKHEYYYNYLANNSDARRLPFLVLSDEYEEYLPDLIDLGHYVLITPENPYNVAKRIKAFLIVFCEPQRQIEPYFTTIKCVALGGVQQKAIPQISLGSHSKNLRMFTSFLKNGYFPRNQLWVKIVSA